MNEEQLDVLNTVQDVLKGLVVAVGTLQPHRTAEFATILQAFAQQQDMNHVSRTMLLDLAHGLDLVAQAQGLTRQQ